MFRDELEAAHARATQLERELEEINAAIKRYNWVFRTYSGPLPETWDDILEELKSKGFLLDGSGRYNYDAGGQPYTPGPPPVQYVTTQGSD